MNNVKASRMYVAISVCLVAAIINFVIAATAPPEASSVAWIAIVGLSILAVKKLNQFFEGRSRSTQSA